ncbi:MAG: SigB/SigF/SigG family RNA polymerase sigma factor [Bacillota bacterium]|nr:SigB/SigF/SigG family RNA polymerase sigma factor [Bacillota bacterium]
MYNYKKVVISGVNTYNLPTISWKEMKSLFIRLADGEKAVREELINCNLKLVLSVLKGFTNRGENMDDLFQIGCIGLMKAIDNFKLEHSVNFSTYAVPMILGEVKRYLRDNNYVHMSRSLKTTAQKIQSVRDNLLQKNQKEPTLTELAYEMGITPEEIVLAYNANMEPLSFFEPVFSDSTDPLHIIDLLKDVDNDDERWLETIALKEALEKLSPRERYILIARFFQGKTQMEVAQKVGISQAQISRIEKSALRFVRSYYNEQGSREEQRESHTSAGGEASKRG